MKKQDRSKQKQAGFTLIEVLIAMVIFAIGIMSVFALQITSSKGNATANRLNESTVEFSRYLEEIFVRDYSFAADTGTVGNISWTRTDGIPGVSSSIIPTAAVETITVTVTPQGWGAKPITISYVKSNR